MNTASANLKLNKKNNPATTSFDSYSSWDFENIIPEDDSFSNNNDTTFRVSVNKGNQHPYNHPINGPVTSHYGWRNNILRNDLTAIQNNTKELVSVETLNTDINYLLEDIKTIISLTKFFINRSLQM